VKEELSLKTDPSEEICGGSQEIGCAGERIIFATNYTFQAIILLILELYGIICKVYTN